MNKIKLTLNLVEICSLIALISMNALGIVNSLKLLNYEYSQDSQLRIEVDTQLDYLSNEYNSSTFWMFFNFQIACTVFTQLVLFMILALKLSDRNPFNYFHIIAISFGVQIFLTLQILWPFSPYNQYGKQFKEVQQDIFHLCEYLQQLENPSQYMCEFSKCIFHTISFSQATIIITLLSISSLYASIALNQPSQPLHKRWYFQQSLLNFKIFEQLEHISSNVISQFTK